MRTPTVLSSIALLCAGAALVVTVVSRPSDSRALIDDEGGSDLAAVVGEQALTRRVDALEREVRVLRREVQILSEDGPHAGRAIDAQGIVVDDGVISANTAGDAIEAKVERHVEEKVQAMVKAELEAENTRRWEWRSEQWKERNQERVAEMRTDHDVDEETAHKIEEMLSAEQTEMSAIFQSSRESGLGRGDIRDKVREIRHATDENVKALLDEDQAVAWDEKRIEERGWGRGGGGGGGALNRRDQ